jgi:hypothetical protein
MMTVQNSVIRRALSRTLWLLVLFTFCYGFVHGQDSVQTDQSINKKRLRHISIAAATGYTIGLTGLYHLWYKNSEAQSFRFFNDNAEWKQVDKFGHFGSAFYLSYGTYKALRWSGLPQQRSSLISAATGFLMLLPIEVFDGFSDAYGASTGDLLANAGGATFFLGQQALWKEIRIYPKFSFHPTQFSQLRPNVLGNGSVSEFFKDYNGQTYWFSFDIDKFVAFPKWLNLTVGYGAENMVYARDYQNLQHGFNPYRQYYLALDFDLTAIKTRSKALKTIIFFANIIRIPGPALSFSTHGTQFHPFYF